MKCFLLIPHWEKRQVFGLRLNSNQKAKSDFKHAAALRLEAGVISTTQNSGSQPDDL